MPSTYSTIQTNTLTAAAATVTLSSIPSTYTDLVLVITGTASQDGNGLSATFNGITSTQYSFTYMYGEGTGTGASGRRTDGQFVNIGNVSTSLYSNRVYFQNYSNTGVFKPYIARANLSARYDVSYAGQWRNTAAINSIALTIEGAGSPVFNSGSTFTLYGIKAA